MFRGAWNIAKQVLTGRMQPVYARYLLMNKLRGIDLMGVQSAAANVNDCTDSGGPYLESILRKLPIGSDDAIVDLGCGKAGAVMTLAKFFRRVDGVEIMPELAKAAAKNIAAMNLQHKSNILQEDAVRVSSDVGAIEKYRWVYMFNPFPEPVFRQVMRNIADSLRRQPRNLSVIYNNPVHAGIVIAELGTPTRTEVYSVRRASTEPGEHEHRTLQIFYYTGE